MKRYPLLIALLLQSFALCAQYRIRGAVTDSVGSPIPSAVVVLIPADGGAQRHDITTADGRYELRGEGRVQLHVSSLGYRPHAGAPFTVVRDTLLPAIVLPADELSIDEVVVVGERQTPSIRTENGKLIYTPANSSIAAGATALDLLKKTPGVFVDGQNNISLDGKNGVLVILNGRQTYISGEELAALLKATPSSAVSSIEVMHSPSAQYDAEGSGGLININLHKKRSDGFYLSLNNGVSYWNHLRQNTELSVSSSAGRFSWSAGYNHAFGYYDMDYGMHRIQEGKYYYSPTDDTEKRKTISGNLDMEYALSERQTLGGRIDINTLFGPGTTSTVTEIRDAATGRLEETLCARNDYFGQKSNRYGGSLYYTAAPREGVRYTVDANYAWFDGGSGNRQPNKRVAPDGTLLQDRLYTSDNRRDIHIWALTYDQQHPLWRGELKSGLKYSSVGADNGYRFYDATGAEALLDTAQSNDFDYTEQIAAAYLLYARPLGDRLRIEAGLRGEYTRSVGRLHSFGGQGDETNRRHYADLFPSGLLSWRIGSSHTLALSYASRIDRPSYPDLNPFEYLLDELSSWKGNPFLSPQKSRQTNLSYTHNRTALTASYASMKDYKAQITDTLAGGKVIMTPRNIGTRQQLSLTLYQGLRIARWWEMTLNLTGSYVRKRLAFDAVRTFDMEGFAGLFSIRNTLLLPGRIQMELNGSYATRRPGASNEYLEPTGSVDVGLSRSFADKRWTLFLAMSDLFWTSRWDNYSAYGDFELRNWGRSETRQVKLNVTYRFGKQKEPAHTSRFDELDRL